MKRRNFDLLAFRNYVASRGGRPTALNYDNGECYAFRHDGIRGSVCQRLDGQYTMVGLARVYCEDFDAATASARKESAAVTRVRLSADQCDLAAAILAGEERAACYVDSCTRGDSGGWGVHIVAGFSVVEVYGGALRTTPARAEISAALIAAKLLPAGCRAKIISEGLYLRRGLQWIEHWRAIGFRSPADGNPIPDADLWTSLDDVCSRRLIAFKWIAPGDKNFDLKNRAADLARDGILSIDQWENLDA